MGIAGFFVWLSRWYPDCIDNIPSEVSEAAAKGKYSPCRSHQRYDNLYIDMNGLIHPCCHDTAPLPEPETEEEMFRRIFEEVQRLYNVVQPRKCVVMCIDGVAPRSKMNQQRMRRFRAAEEREESDRIAVACADIIERTMKLPRPSIHSKWDHNVITPTTPFMERLGVALEWFIVKKLNEDPAWRHVTVVLSDDHLPGEGEHKIMDYIRGLRSQEGYDPTTSHVIHGMDADLICLGLATHEPNFYILRNQLTEQFAQDRDKFCYFNLKKYRSRLKEDFAPIGKFDFERVVDDFVFLCFFVGNDFLPHVPLVSIKTKGIELLLDNYVRNFADHRYLTCGGEVRFGRLQRFLTSFVATMTEPLKKEYLSYTRSKERVKGQVEERISKMEREAQTARSALAADRSNAQQVSEKLLHLYSSIRKERARCVVGGQPLGFSYASDDFRDAYYARKFEWNPADGREEFEARIATCAREYLRGTQWVMRYYTTGCPSWGWFYPYHYAPLLEDLAANALHVDVAMELGEPLHPVEQLLSVLPRQSVHGLPEALHSAVLDHASPLAKFYPVGEVDVDYSEANFSYQGVIRLPFIDCDDLKKTCRELVEIEADEGQVLVFVHGSSSVAKEAKRLFESAVAATQSDASARELVVPISESMARQVPIAGELAPFADEWPRKCHIECPDAGIAEIKKFGSPIKCNEVRCFAYFPRKYCEYKQHLLICDGELKEGSGAAEAKTASPASNKRKRRDSNVDVDKEATVTSATPKAKRTKKMASTESATKGSQPATAAKRRRTEVDATSASASTKCKPSKMSHR